MLLWQCHGEYKDVLLNKNCLRHSMNRIQSKDHRIGTYKINKISLSYFDNKIQILVFVNFADFSCIIFLAQNVLILPNYIPLK